MTNSISPPEGQDKTLFTPGPWFTGRLVLADADDDFGTISVGQQDLSDRPHKDAHYEDTICEVWQNPNLAEDAEANARLIAAAPALYEALSEMVRLSQMGLEESLREPEENGNFAAFNRAVAALNQVRAIV